MIFTRRQQKSRVSIYHRENEIQPYIYLLDDKMSYCNISRNVEAMGMDVEITHSIDAGRTGHPFCRYHIQIHFHEWRLLYFDSNFIEIYSSRSNWQYASNGFDSGLVPIRWHPIIWTNYGWFWWRIYASLGFGVIIIVHWNLTGTISVRQLTEWAKTSKPLSFSSKLISAISLTLRHLVV